MNRKVAISLVLVALAVGAGLGSRAWSQPTAKSPQYSSVIKVGAVLVEPPATLGAVGRAVRDGLALAQTDLNAEWKDSPHVELVFKDSGGSAAGAIEKLAELKKEGISLIADVVGTDLLAGALGKIRDERVLVVSGSANDPKLATAKGAPYVFLAAPTENGLGNELGHFARELGIKKPVLAVTEGERGAHLRNGFLRFWAPFGRPSVVEIASGQAQAQKVAEKIAALAPDALVLLTEPRDTRDVFSEIARASLDLRVLAPESTLSALDLKVAPGILSKTLALAVEDSSPPPRRAAVEAAWKKAGGSGEARPELFSAYDALQVLARAARDGQGDPEKTIPRLRVMDYDGCTGRVAFDQEGFRRAPATKRRAFTDQGVSVPYSPFEGPVPALQGK
jgi:ABC-type branched-subunit amino acid transport system substrate-binding protein